jgi:NADH-quinone oxidoreductase subunit C
MTENEIIKLLEDELGESVLSSSTPRKRKVLATIEPAALRKAVEVLIGGGSRFVALAAADLGLDIQLLYHLDLRGELVVLRVLVAKEKLEVDSVVDLTPAAEWAEREAAELVGVSFKEHPAPKHLVLPEEWPADKPPLSKPFKTKLPERFKPVAESVVSVGTTAAITPLMRRRRREAGLPEQPPTSYASDSSLKEVQELVRRSGFDKKAGYDWEKKRLRGKK